jgi:putative membrane protein
LANERTALAYSRTALAFVVGGLAVAGSRGVAGTPLWLAALGVPLSLLGAAVAWAGGRRFLATQRAMRTGQPLGVPIVAAVLPAILALIALVGSAVAALALFVG